MLLFWFLNIFLIPGWLNPQMQNPRIWRAHCISIIHQQNIKNNKKTTFRTTYSLSFTETSEFLLRQKIQAISLVRFLRIWEKNRYSAGELFMEFIVANATIDVQSAWQKQCTNEYSDTITVSQVSKDEVGRDYLSYKTPLQSSWLSKLFLQVLGKLYILSPAWLTLSVR